jgi:uncharacterized protein YabE (DUF348 family)
MKTYKLTTKNIKEFNRQIVKEVVKELKRLKRRDVHE